MRHAVLIGTLAILLSCSLAQSADPVRPSLSQWGGPLFLAQQPPGTTQPPTPPERVATGPGLADPDLTNLESLEESTVEELLGDANAIVIPPSQTGPTPPTVGGIVTTPGTPSGVARPRRVFVLPSVRTFKITDNESPRPQDRVYFSFNYVNDFADALNRRLGADVHNVNLYRETFGVEKTFLGGMGSVGLRVPLNSMNSEGGIAGVDGSQTDPGDLSVIVKYVLWQSEDRRNLVSSGLAVTAPTGPAGFAGIDAPSLRHSTSFQPFVGYYRTCDNWYLHGFVAVDVPADSRDVTVLYNDFGVGYYAYRNCDPCKWLTSIAPTVELHVDTPLNHRGSLDTSDGGLAFDVVNLTTGLNIDLCRQTRMSIGVVTPLTGPRPYDFEVLAQLRWRF
jgi:hypothetical protein